jgi:AraC-like DNA-binding protein
MAYGFSSLSHFVKVFRQFTGVSPKQYKSGF